MNNNCCNGEVPCSHPDCPKNYIKECPECGAPLCKEHSKDCWLCKDLKEFEEKEESELKIISEKSGLELKSFYDIEDNWENIKEIVKEYAPDLYEWKTQIDLERDPNSPYNPPTSYNPNDPHLPF